MFKRFVRYYKPHRRLLCADMGASLLVAMIGILYPIVTRTMLNDLIPNIGKGAADTSAADGDAVSYIAINFCIDRSETSHTPALPFPVRCDDDSCDYGTLFADALRADQLREPGGALERDGLILQIIGRLYRAYRLPEPQRRLRRRVAPAVQLLRTDCASPALTVDALAQSCAMSARQFRTVFRAAYGVPPYRYLQEFRLQKAALLLRSTTKSVTAIAEACGFSDIYSFSHSY